MGDVEELTPAQKRVRNILAKDPDHFKKAGSKGGKKSAELGVSGGFRLVPGLAREAINKRWGNEPKADLTFDLNKREESSK